MEAKQTVYVNRVNLPEFHFLKKHDVEKWNFVPYFAIYGSIKVNI